MLTRATPTRLVCRSGRWVLELTRLEAVDRDVFQPRLTRLEGADSILAMLRRSEDGQLLASGAAQIMRSQQAPSYAESRVSSLGRAACLASSRVPFLADRLLWVRPGYAADPPPRARLHELGGGSESPREVDGGARSRASAAVVSVFRIISWRNA